MKNILIIFFILPALLVAGQKTDYILLSDPASVHILNKYEQQAQTHFLPGTPFQLLEKDYLLSDGITSAYKCYYQNNVYYIMPNSGALEIIKNCTVLEDTVLLVQSNITFQLLDGSRKSLDKGQQLERIFKKGRRTFVFTGIYGWCYLADNSWKRVIKSEPLTTGIPPKLFLRINSRIETINKYYTDFFTFFNQKYKQNQPIPQWQFAREGQTLRLFLNHPQTASHLRKSIPSFLNDLEKLLLGTNLRCVNMENEIIITADSKL